MAYPFPDIEIKVYSKTFLKDVHVGIMFKEIPLNETLKTKSSEFFCKEFGLKKLEVTKMPKAVSVFSKDEKIKFGFGLGRVDLTIKREAYRSLVDASPLGGKVYAYLKMVEQSEVRKVMLSKYNELDFEAKDSMAIVDVMSSVFSKNLMRNVTQEDLSVQKELSRWEKVLLFKGEDASDSEFTIEYGFRKQPKEVGRNSLTLKTIIESNTESVEVSKVPALLTEYNQILDNAFHWSVSDQVISAMKKK